MAEPKVNACRRCGRPVRVSAAQYDVFEQMHYVCFHYEFEHDPVDPDEECAAGGCPSMTVNPRPMRRPANVVAFRDLALGLADRLTPEQQTWGEEFMQANEWGLALEMYADWLSEDELPITPAERESFRSLATQMGNRDRVMEPLNDCPDRA